MTKRLSLTLFTLWVLSSGIFFLVHMIPGDPVDFILGEQSFITEKENLRKILLLDQPLQTQYIHYFQNIFRGSLGDSLFFRKPVASLIVERWGATLELACVAMMIAISLSLTLGIISALKKDTIWDYSLLALATLGVSIPTFSLGPFLVLLFSLKLGLFPLSGRDEALSIALPSLTLGIAMTAILMRFVRASFYETLKEDFVRTAKAKGLTFSPIVFKHVFRVAINPVVTLMGLQFGALLAGAVVTEKIFAWPGLGSLLLEAIERRDYPVIQGCVLTIAVTYTLINLLTDLLHAKLDPRILLGSS